MTLLRIGKHRIVKNIASLRKVNIAHPYLSGCIVYYMFYVAIFWGVKLIFAKQLTDITLMEGARSALAEFSTVSLWGNLGRIQSRYSFNLKMSVSMVTN